MANLVIPTKEECGPLCGRICPCDDDPHAEQVKLIKQKNRIDTDAFWRTSGQLDCRKKPLRKISCKDNNCKQNNSGEDEPVNYGGGAVYNYTVTRGNKISNSRNVDYTSSLKTASLNGKTCLGVVTSKQYKKQSKSTKKQCVYGCEPVKLTPPKSFNLSISRNKGLSFLGTRKTF